MGVYADDKCKKVQRKKKKQPKNVYVFRVTKSCARVSHMYAGADGVHFRKCTRVLLDSEYEALVLFLNCGLYGKIVKRTDYNLRIFNRFAFL